MTEKEKQAYRKQETEAREAMEQAWENDKDSYIPSVCPDSREENSYKLDTNNQQRVILGAQDPHFEDLEANWTDKTSDRADRDRKCDEVVDKIFRIYGQTRHWDKSELRTHPEYILRDLGSFLNRCFSERIKITIVEMVADDETVEGACKHLFNVYHEDNKRFADEIHESMCIWYTLKNAISEVHTYNAFLERAWHLKPTSQFFSNSRYGQIVEAIRSKNADTQNRSRAKYANPYDLLEALNETFKKLDYSLRHTTDPAQTAKLANSQVKVSGALFVINNRLEDKHQERVESAKRIALYTKPEIETEQIIDVEEQKALPDV